MIIQTMEKVRKVLDIVWHNRYIVMRFQESKAAKKVGGQDRN